MNRLTLNARRLVLAVLGVVWLFPTYLIVANALRPAATTTRRTP